MNELAKSCADLGGAFAGIQKNADALEIQFARIAQIQAEVDEIKRRLEKR